jgi:hypothetical protein
LTCKAGPRQAEGKAGPCASLPRPKLVNRGTQQVAFEPHVASAATHVDLAELPSVQELNESFLVGSENGNVDVGMRTRLSSKEQVKCPSACEPPAKRRVLKKPADLIERQRDTRRGLGLLHNEMLSAANGRCATGW